MTRFVRLWVRLRSGLWFVPALMVLLLMGLALLLTGLDRAIDPETRRRWPALVTPDAGSARDMLAAISGAMVTVAGVVFSVTIGTLALASSQYSPRVLRAFTRDLVSQVALGGMAGSFAYCVTVLLVLAAAENEAAPSLAVFTGFVLAIASVFVLIFFIHHAAGGIQASSIIASITRDTIVAIERTFAPAGEPERPDVSRGELAAGGWTQAPALATGYIESVDLGALAGFAEERGAVVRMDRAAGNFVIRGRPLISVRLEGALTAADTAALNRAHVVGEVRTVDGDPDFGIRQMVDIAMKALSPGVNDTTTAVVCVDHLGAVLARAAELRERQDAYTPSGRLAVLVRAPSFHGLLAKAFDQIRQNAAGNIAVITALLNGIGTLAECVASGSRLDAVSRQLDAVAELVDRSIDAPQDKRDLQHRIEGLSRRVRAA